MKDIFIDNNIASRHFSNPIDDEYEKLINWLDTRSDVKENDAHLVVSRFLINELVKKILKHFKKNIFQRKC